MFYPQSFVDGSWPLNRRLKWPTIRLADGSSLVSMNRRMTCNQTILPRPQIALFTLFYLIISRSGIHSPGAPGVPAVGCDSSQSLSRATTPTDGPCFRRDILSLACEYSVAPSEKRPSGALFRHYMARRLRALAYDLKARQLSFSKLPCVPLGRRMRRNCASPSPSVSRYEDDILLH